MQAYVVYYRVMFKCVQCWPWLRVKSWVFPDLGQLDSWILTSVSSIFETRRVVLEAMRFTEMLTRFRLHHCAAYLRKFCDIHDVRKKTLVRNLPHGMSISYPSILQLETTIYTSCGRCRKPLAVPAGSSRVGELNKGRYAYCATCQVPCVVCSIWYVFFCILSVNSKLFIMNRSRLPVRTMLFQCPICNHGGHQACYRDYYLQYPMFDLPTTFLFPSPRNVRGRQRRPPSVAEDDSTSTISQSSNAVEAPVVQEPSRTAKLRGHPCAAGCGHFCWAVSGFDF